MAINVVIGGEPPSLELVDRLLAAARHWPTSDWPTLAPHELEDLLRFALDDPQNTADLIVVCLWVLWILAERHPRVVNGTASVDEVYDELRGILTHVEHPDAEPPAPTE